MKVNKPSFVETLIINDLAYKLTPESEKTVKSMLQHKIDLILLKFISKDKKVPVRREIEAKFAAMSQIKVGGQNLKTSVIIQELLKGLSNADIINYREYHKNMGSDSHKVLNDIKDKQYTQWATEREKERRAETQEIGKYGVATESITAAKKLRARIAQEKFDAKLKEEQKAELKDIGNRGEVTKSLEAAKKLKAGATPEEVPTPTRLERVKNYISAFFR